WHLRGELGASLGTVQQLLLTMQQGIDGQIRAFGERLDGGVAAIDARAQKIGEAVAGEMAVMKTEANANREGLRQLIERKLAEALESQANAGKGLREELGCNFHRL